MDNISLETSFHWLSDDLVRFKIIIGVGENMQKCNTVSDVFASSQQQAVMRREVITLCCHNDNSHICGWNKHINTQCGLPGEGEFKVTVWT